MSELNKLFLNKTDPGLESPSLLPRQLVKYFPLSGGGAGLYGLPVHLDLPAAPEGGPGRVVVVVDHTPDVVQLLPSPGYVGRGTGVVDVPLAFLRSEVTVKPQPVPRGVGLERGRVRTGEVSLGYVTTLHRLSRRAPGGP